MAEGNKISLEYKTNNIPILELMFLCSVPGAIIFDARRIANGCLNNPELRKTCYMVAGIFEGLKLAMDISLYDLADKLF